MNWYGECPWCGALIGVFEAKDFESFTMREVATHLQEIHPEQWAEWRAKNPFGMPYAKLRHD